MAFVLSLSFSCPSLHSLSLFCPPLPLSFRLPFFCTLSLTWCAPAGREQALTLACAAAARAGRGGVFPLPLRTQPVPPCHLCVSSSCLVFMCMPLLGPDCMPRIRTLFFSHQLQMPPARDCAFPRCCLLSASSLLLSLSTLGCIFLESSLSVHACARACVRVV